MDRSLLAAILAALALVACGQETSPVTAPAASPTETALAPAVAPVTPLDYAAPANWLCRPEAEDTCEQYSNTTLVSADGTLRKYGALITAGEPFVDCFYVYPTVSRDPGGNADATPGPEEQEIIRQQFSGFRGICRMFAPVYRQVTLTALAKLRAGEQAETNREMAYADVKAAWQHYLATDNAGRGVVLIGHSQGAGLLTRLIASEIDGKPEQDKLISAILPGADIEVPQSAPTGGTFASIPLCVSGESTGCVIAWSAFRAETPPPDDSLFGRATTTGMRVACVNPAELDESAEGQLNPHLPVGAILFDELAPPAPWTADNAEIDTPFVALPGLLPAQCINRNGASYLAVTVNADPADPRTDTINGDVVVDGKIRPEWGLHLFDMHLAMGNLVNIVDRQSGQWTRAHNPDTALLPAIQKPQ